MKNDVCLDFLKIFTKTKTVNRYSPSAHSLARACNLSYQDEYGNFYQISEADIIIAAKKAGIKTKKLKNYIAVAISTEQFKAFKPVGVFSTKSICIHGPVRYTLIEDSLTQSPKIKLLCPICPNGFQRPSHSEIASAEKWLLGANSTLPERGAIYIAAQNLGYTFDRSQTNLLNFKKR